MKPDKQLRIPCDCHWKSHQVILEFHAQGFEDDDCPDLTIAVLNGESSIWKRFGLAWRIIREGTDEFLTEVVISDDEIVHNLRLFIVEISKKFLAAKVKRDFKEQK